MMKTHTKEHTMTDFNLVLSFVALDATYDQLVSLSEMMKLRREKLAKTVKRSIKEGQNVTFNHKGIDYAGVVMSVKIKKATVECTIPNSHSYDTKMRRVPSTIRYDVPLNMLKAA
jgi:hypothetical protein